MTLNSSGWLERLSTWQSPASMAMAVAECDNELGRFATMINHGTGFWRDSYTASRFAAKVGASAVRLLHPLPYPDFAIRLEGTELWFEATEVMRPNRRRGDEYRTALADRDAGRSMGRDDPEENWLTANRSYDALSRASQNKAMKPYAIDCGLVIYLNDTEYGTDPDPIVATFGDATCAAGRVFQSVYVMWSGDVHHVWQCQRQVG